MKRSTTYKCHIFLFAISIAPIILWIVGAGVPAISDLSDLLLFLGKSAALIGISLFMINPLLSMRHAWTEYLLGDLGTVYRLHKRSGQASLYLVALHPLLLIAGRLLAGRDLQNIWEWRSLLILTGTVGLIAFTLLTALAIYAHITHQRWIAIHRLFGVLIPLFLLHALSAKAQVFQITSLKVYMVLVGAAGFTAFLYRLAYSSLHLGKYRYKVAEVFHQKGKVTEVVLKPTNVSMNYVPGQYAFVSFMEKGISSEAHPYSFTTANNGPYLRFAIKQLGDDTLAIAQKLRVHTPAIVEGPYGTLSLHSSKNKKQVWIAGGIGITPFLSMARALSSRHRREIMLFYSAQKIEDAPFVEELEDIAKILISVLRVHVIDSETQGFITTKLLQEQLGKLDGYDFMICGPPIMMQSLQSGLLESGVPKTQIHTENFSL